MKSLTIATTLLVVVFALAVVGFTQPRPEGFGPGMGGEPGMGEGPGGAGGCLAAIPDLTTEQTDALEAIHESHWAEMESTHEEMMTLRDSLHEEMQKPEPDTAVVRNLLTQMGEMKIEMTLSRLEMRQTVRGLLTAEQRVVFDEMQQKMGERGPHHGGGGPMSGGPGGGGPGCGGGDRPRDGSGRG